MSHRRCTYDGEAGSVDEDECIPPPLRYPQYAPLPEPNEIGGSAPIALFRSIQTTALRAPHSDVSDLSIPREPSSMARRETKPEDDAITPAPAIPRSPDVLKAGFKQPRLRPIPLYHPASLCMLKLSLDENPLLGILNNLSRALRIMSIQPKFHDDPIAVALLTKEYTEMHLSLWQSRSGNHVMVEIQHRKGDSVVFKRYAHGILEATRGRFDHCPMGETPLDAESVRQAESVLLPSSCQDDAFVAFQSVHSLLCSSSHEARCLGLESLCVFTDPRRTSIKTSIIFSVAVLLARVPIPALVSQGRFVHRVVLELVLLRRFWDSTAEEPLGHAECEAEDLFTSDDGSTTLRGGPPEYAEFMSRVFYLSLAVIVNAIEVVATFQASSELRVMDTADMAIMFLENSGSLDRSADVLETLLDCIRKAELKYHNAYLAARGLKFLCLASPGTRRSLISLNALEYVARAHQIGSFNHALLEEECRQLWEVLHAGRD